MSISEDRFQQGNTPAADSQAMFPNGWTRIDNDLRKARLGAYPKLLFTILRTYTDARGMCWPSFQTLADDMEVSRSTVVRAMKKLEDECLVRKVRRVSENGSLTSNEYWVAESLRGYVLSDTRVVSERTSNKNQLTRPLQDFNSCPYVRNAREAETTENLNPKPEREESPSPVAGSPLRGGREEVSRGGVPARAGGAWGDRVPLPAPKHVYGSGASPSEKPAKAPVGDVQGSPVPSPTPDVPKRPRKPSWNWMQSAPKRWADDGKLTTIPPTFVPSPQHVAFGGAWGLDVESIGKAFVAKHLREGTLVQCWDLHFAELLEMKRLDKADAEREAEALKTELEAAEAARQARRREWSERLESQKAGAVPPTAEFLALRPRMDELRAKRGGKPKPKGEPYGWRADSHAGWESDRGPRTAVHQQRDAGVLVHSGLDAEETKPGDAAVGGRGDDVRPLRRVEADGGERRRIVGEGEPGDCDGQDVCPDVRARRPEEDVDPTAGGRDRPVPQVRDGEAGEDDGPVDAAKEFFAWRRIRDAQLAG